MNKWLPLVLSAVFLLSACGGSSDSGNGSKTDQQSNSITEYAKSGGLTQTPNLQDYIDAGVQGVTSENLTQINQVVKDLTEEDVDTSEEIQAILDDLDITIIDVDGDGVADSIDNCINDANTNQVDTDNDGIGDVCDPTNEVPDSNITSVQGNIAIDTIFVINGSGFSTKANAKPLFWWKADFGEIPSTLGRVTSWKGNGFNGAFSTARVAPGSQKSVYVDFHTNSGGSVGGVDFNSDRLYLHRKTYEDFDITTDWGIKPGTTDFKTFNFKTVRLWAHHNNTNGKINGNNIHMSAAGESSPEFRISPEYTDGATYPAEFTKNRLRQIPRAWKTEELEYKTSGINITDGIFQFYQNGLLGTDSKFKNRTTKFPDRYSTIYQAQVSNGTAPNTLMHYDSIYLDDTWHRVLLCPEPTWDTRTNCEVQIPTSWNDSQVTVHINKGGLDMSKASYLYVIDKNGVANLNGWKLTP